MRRGLSTVVTLALLCALPLGVDAGKVKTKRVAGKPVPASWKAGKAATVIKVRSRRPRSDKKTVRLEVIDGTARLNASTGSSKRGRLKLNLPTPERHNADAGFALNRHQVDAAVELSTAPDSGFQLRTGGAVRRSTSWRAAIGRFLTGKRLVRVGGRDAPYEAPYDLHIRSLQLSTNLVIGRDGATTSVTITRTPRQLRKMLARQKEFFTGSEAQQIAAALDGQSVGDVDFELVKSGRRLHLTLPLRGRETRILKSRGEEVEISAEGERLEGSAP